MLPFFDRPDTKWRDLKGCLHFYLVPSIDDPVRDDFGQMVASLHGLPGVGVQPVQYMHVTVQRLNAYIPDRHLPAFADFEQSLQSVFASIPSFELSFSKPEIRREAVEAISNPNQSWEQIVGILRSELMAAGLTDFLEAIPFAPHYSLAYGTKHSDDALTAAALEFVAKSTSFWVNKVHLVAVDQDPESGIFSFQTLREWELKSQSE